MIQRCLVSLILALLISTAVACGGSNSSTTTTGGTADQNAGLKGALLTLDDMPTAGWSAPQVPDQLGAPSTVDCSIDFTRYGAPASQARATFLKTNLGPIVAEALLAYPSGKGKDVWTKTVNSLQNCTAVVTTDSTGVQTTTTMAKIDVPKVGDDTIGFRLSTPDNLVGSLETRVVYVRRGDVILGLVSYGPPQNLLDDASAQALLAKAFAKLNKTFK